MSDQPLLTVLMAVHNGLPYLAASLESMARQTYRDFEFLLIDDASTDGSSELMQSWAERDPRIRLLRQEENRGLTASLNVGLREARGTWIARQDADDISHPRRLELQMAEIGRRPELILLGTNGWLINEDSRPCGLINAPCGDEGLRWSVVFYNPFLHGSVCFHREKIVALGGYDPRFRVAQDYDLWIRVLRHWPADNLRQRLIQYRVHAGSVTAATLESEERRGLLDSVTGQGLDLAGLNAFNIPETVEALRGWSSGSKRADFWSLHRTMLGVFRQQHAPNTSLRAAIALLHWRMAGALRQPWGVLQEMAAALIYSPSLFLGLMMDRMRGAVSE